ncbi:MAG: LeuA family protein [Candidatus Methanofastidiosia archaeon]
MEKFQPEASNLDPDLCNWNVLKTDRKLKKHRIEVWDETLRDGIQQVGVYVSIEDRVRIAEMLDEIGVLHIDAGLPMVSNYEFEAFKRVNELGLKAKVNAAVRTVRDDIDVALKADAKAVSAFVGSSAPRLKKDFKKSAQDLTDEVSDIITYCKEHGLYTIFVTEDTTRAKPEDLKLMYQSAEEAGADMHILSDTVGSMWPEGARNLVRFMREEVKLKKPLSWHGHNDLGLGVATTLASIEEGVVVPHTTCLGFGERSGNVPLEQLVLNLEVRGWEHGIDLKRIQKLAHLVSRAYKIPIPLNSPVVGENAHRHDSGIHVAGIMSCGEEIYSPYLPGLVGREIEIVLGKGCGAANVLFHRPELEKELALKVAFKIKEISLERGKKGEKAFILPQELDSVIEEVRSE